MNHIVFTLVHGTFARNARWTHTNAPLVKSLFTAFGPNTVVQTFGWSGGNSHSARLRAGAGLAGMIRATAAQYPTHKHILVAHSHGGNVVLYALKEIPDIPIDGAVCLGTPFITCKERRIASVQPILKALFVMVLIVVFLLYWTLLVFAVNGWIDLPRNGGMSRILAASLAFAVLFRAWIVLRTIPRTLREVVSRALPRMLSMVVLLWEHSRSLFRSGHGILMRYRELVARKWRSVRVVLGLSLLIVIGWGAITAPELLVAWVVLLSGVAFVALSALKVARWIFDRHVSAKKVARPVVEAWHVEVNRVHRTPRERFQFALRQMMDIIAVALAGVVLTSAFSLLSSAALFPGVAFALVASLGPLALIGPGYQVWRSYIDSLSLLQGRIIDKLQLPSVLTAPVLAIAASVDEARVHLSVMNFFGNIPFALWSRRKIIAVVVVATVWALAVAIFGLVQAMDLSQGSARLLNWLLALGVLGIVVLGFAIAVALFTAIATVLGLLAGMILVSKVTMGSPWGFGFDWFLDHLLVDLRGGPAPPCRGNVTTSRFQLPGGPSRFRRSGLRHTRLCYDEGVIQNIVAWTQDLRVHFAVVDLQ